MDKGDGSAIVTRAAALELSAAPVDLEARFRDFAVSYRDTARRLAWRLVGGDEAAAEDVVQDAFVKAYRALSSFRRDSSLETWFYRILVNQTHKHRRWRAVRERWLGGWDEQRAVSSVAPGDPALQRRISRALDKLTRRQREAFVLVHFEGFTVRETGELLATPEGTVKSHLHRALKALRIELADLHDSSGRSQP
jgi:RNA polymerase sigma factor (sigma-70 family)